MRDHQEPLPWPDPPLRDEAVVLTGFRPADVSVLVATAGDPLIARWTAWPTRYTEAEALAGLDRRERDRRTGTALCLALRLTSDPALAGGCDLRPLDRAAGRYEVAYWVAPWARGRSLATRALRLLSAWALTELGANRLVALVQPGNAASLRTVAAAGFTRHRLLPAHRVRAGRPLDLLEYRLEA